MEWVTYARTLFLEPAKWHKLVRLRKSMEVWATDAFRKSIWENLDQNISNPRKYGLESTMPWCHYAGIYKQGYDWPMDLAERAICEYVSVIYLLRSSIGPLAFLLWSTTVS